MPKINSSKTPKQLQAIVLFGTAGSPHASTVLDLRATYGAIIHMKLSNIAVVPTANVQVEVARTSTGPWFKLGSKLTASPTPVGVVSASIEVSRAERFARTLLTVDVGNVNLEVDASVLDGLT